MIQDQLTCTHAIEQSAEAPPAPAHHMAAATIEQVLSKNSASHRNDQKLSITTLYCSCKTLMTAN